MSVTAAALDPAAECFHCGLPVPAGSQWSVEIDHVIRPMCCPGCEAVAQSIVDNGLTTYYATRTSWSPSAGKDALVPPELQVYDAPEVSSQFTVRSDAHACEATFSVEGIRCAACMWLIERRLAALPGVLDANLNVATERLAVRWDEEHCKPSDILIALRGIGYLAYPFDAVRHGDQLRRAGKVLFRRLFIAGLAMMQVMMYVVPVYLATDGTMSADMHALMRWASLVLTVPAVFYSAQPFFRGAWSNLKARTLGMDIPVALGIGAAFGASVLATIKGRGEVYFDSVTMFIFLLLCSRYLELLARRNAASALEKLQRALPASAACMPGYPASRDVAVIPAMQLVAGDYVLVKPGEAVPADSVIVEGESALDLSLLTGESRPQRRHTGDALAGGAVNTGQPVVVRVSKPTCDSTLSNLVKLIEKAGQAKPRLAQWADRTAAWFVGVLLLLALLVFAAWSWIDPARAWPVAISVLVVSCPCALSLATPSALAAATDRLVRLGVLVVQPHVLETLHRTTHVVFDKTGTLTLGKPVLRRTALLGTQTEERVLQIAAALEGASAHPLAVALMAAQGAGQRSLPGLAVEEMQHLPGQGIEGTIDGVRYRIGSAAFVAQLVSGPPGCREPDDATPVYLADAGGWLARFDLADALRADAREVVEHFKAHGKQVILLSGDRQAAARRIAAQLGIEAAYGDCLPEQKLAFVQRLQADGAVVAMVGDGINDAAVLRAADVSFAMGGGAALAQTHADTVLLSGRLSSVAQASVMAARTMAVIRQNLIWAVLYNAVAIPAAALGLLNPWMSGIGMSLSSAAVVLNALRLNRAPRAGRRLPQQAPSLAA